MWYYTLGSFFPICGSNSTSRLSSVSSFFALLLNKMTNFVIFTVCMTQADIIFILDGSSSVKAADFAKQLQFIKSLVGKFGVGPNAVKVGVLQYSTNTVQEFNLNTHSTEAAILAAVDRIKQKKGGTNTAVALSTARTSSFTAAKGDRPNVPNIVIVMTDGKSNNMAATAREANRLRNIASVFAIGVGSNVRTAELKAMANDPDSKYVFTVTDFSALSNIETKLATEACAQATTAPPEITTKPTPICMTQADIIFILDGSSSVKAADFAKQLQFIKSLVRKFGVGPNAVKVGVLQYSTNTVQEFNLNTHSTEAAILAAVDRIKQKKGGTNTAVALSTARTSSFTAAKGDRPNVPNIVIVMTDGKSNNMAATAREANRLRNIASVFAIGVGSNVRTAELKAMANDPDSKYVFTVTDFSALSNIETKLATEACAPCKGQTDITIILDGSESVNAPDFAKQLQFIKFLVRKFEVGPNAVQVGVLQCYSYAVQEFNLNTHSTEAAILDAVDRIKQKRGGTNTAYALSTARTSSFTAAKGDRSNVPNIVIVMTDGKSDNRMATVKEAIMLRNIASVYTIGVGSDVNTDELKAIANVPDSKYVFTVTDYSALSSITTQLATDACTLCKDQADITIILDGSESVNAPDFAKQLQFIKSLVRKFEVGPNAAQVGVLQCYSYAVQEFNLNTHSTEAAILAAVDRIKQKRGGTNTAYALSTARTSSFTAAKGDRSNVPNVVIVMTDGKSDNRMATVKEAIMLRNFASVFAIGVGSNVDTVELKAMATDPDSKYVFTVTDFSLLSNITTQIAADACAQTTTKPASKITTTPASTTVTPPFLPCFYRGREKICP
ncbi:collagen alpha-1(XII) chain isoform X1 [Lingula anatina]|uniref:Collagen alpha-1(XII) chain isoform X1 n=1 Tax=Lingula anatina TaxID=7574 RepID=A0A1S3JCB7_LINAN|nr:collagen alpha-1(XII) chain isoform X1 [Lingula anatina]|eukprot:XP_013407529.1 collagen alpha-1(XII) chain isoform X1 [Lingula anatina]